ncbi:ComF family protein [Candidatus Kaiserbacteria bacterium]|nr:MAG: ComF family protein [Candidatus Kaiserbacteria bacterium]
MLSRILSLLFPPTRIEILVSNTEYLSPHPANVRTLRGSIVLTCTHYDDTSANAAIKLLKKHGSVQAAKLLAQLLYDTLLEELSDIEIWNPKHIILIPMPLSPKRKRERGFNQITKVCAQLPAELRSCVVTDVLLQTKHVPMQKTLAREQRLKNVAGIFSISRPEKVRGAHVILIDDVITTGATMDEAIKTFEEIGVSVTAVALARA